jgi:hypothetical protein
MNVKDLVGAQNDPIASHNQEQQQAQQLGE